MYVNFTKFYKANKQKLNYQPQKNYMYADILTGVFFYTLI